MEDNSFTVFGIRSQILFSLSLDVGSKIDTIIRQMETAMNKTETIFNGLYGWRWLFGRQTNYGENKMSHRQEQMIRVVVVDDENGQIGASIAIKIFPNNKYFTFSLKCPLPSTGFLCFGCQKHDCDENQKCKYENLA